MENSGSTPAFTVETFVQTFGTFEDEVLLDKNDIYTHKQQHVTIDMKTKIVQHVPRINISIRHKTCDM